MKVWQLFRALKSFLVIHLSHITIAKIFFQDLKLKVILGKQYLSDYIGSINNCNKWLEDKVYNWKVTIKKLKETSKKNSQLSYHCFEKSVMNEWIFIQ